MTVRASIRRLAREQDGSILPLVIGYMALALALILASAVTTSLFLAQKTVDAIADAAALAGADGFVLTVTGDSAVARLTDVEVALQAQRIVDGSDPRSALVSATTPDGVTARVEVSLQWHPPLISAILPDGYLLTATGTSRTALDAD